MTTEQKLQLFVQTAINNVTEKKEKAVKEYEAQLKEDFEKQKKDYEAVAATSYRLKEEHAILESNRSVANEAAKIKQDLSAKNEELTNQIYEEVKNKLNDYKSTTKYAAFLAKTIETVKTLADSTPYRIYLDESDAELTSYLEEKAGCKLHISKKHILGGLLAKIPEKNLFVDESFQSKLQESKENFLLS